MAHMGEKKKKKEGIEFQDASSPHQFVIRMEKIDSEIQITNGQTTIVTTNEISRRTLRLLVQQVCMSSL